MNRLLEKAIAETAKLPERDQEAVGALILAELESERRGDDLFAKSQDLLASLAEEARQESELVRAIEISSNLLALGHDWDDAGAKPIHVSTWTRATELLRRTALKAGHSLPVPRISPCADGSIDLYWKTSTFKLLVNIQPGDTNRSDFYGETTTGIALKGTIKNDTNDLNVILAPLLTN